MRIKPQTTILISIVIVLAGIGLTSILGIWTTQSTKVPQKYNGGENSGQYNPADIKGSYTFSEISNLFNIPIEDLAAAFSVEKDKAADFKCKDLEAIFVGSPNEIGTGSVRMFVAFYLGLPYELTEDTYQPDSAAKILKEKSNMSQANLIYLDSHTVPIS